MCGAIVSPAHVRDVAIASLQQCDVVIKVLAKKPRGTATGLADKEVALEADAEQDAAAKMQARIRGNNARKEQAVDPVLSVQILAELSSTLTKLSPAGKADGTDSWMAAARAAGWGPPVSGGAAVA